MEVVAINAEQNADAVQILEDALALARRGELREVLVVMRVVTPEGKREVRYRTTRIDDAAAVVGELEVLKHEVLSNW